MNSNQAIEDNMDKFEKVAAALGWVAERDRKIEGWHTFVIFNGNYERRYGVDVGAARYTVVGLATTEFLKFGCYLSSLESGKLSDTTSRMSASKSVEALVKEIQRRVIVPYEKFFGIMIDKAQQARDYSKQTVESAIKIGHILNTPVRGVELDGSAAEVIPNNRDSVRIHKSFPEGMNLDIRFYGESARWEYVSLPHDLHEKICRVIADHFKRAVV